MTWQEIKRIINIADNIILEDPNNVEIRYSSEEEYYKEVLKRYEESKL